MDFLSKSVACETNADGGYNVGITERLALFRLHPQGCGCFRFGAALSITE
jgi:hypothetical protein